MAVCLLVLSGCANSRPTSGAVNASSTAAGTAMIGSRWRVETVKDPTGTMAVPSDHVAMIGFTRDGYVLGDDTLNGAQCRYRLTSSGYHARETILGAKGYAAHDEARVRLLTAVDSMFGGRIAADLRGDRLTLTSPAATLTLRWAQAQPDFAKSVGIPSASATTTR